MKREDLRNIAIYNPDGLGDMEVLATYFSDAKFTDTTYNSGACIDVIERAGNYFEISNAGVRSISTGSSNGTIKVNTNGVDEDVSVKGLGSAAYTESSAYASSNHTHNYAGSSSAGGSATTALALTTSAETNSVWKPNSSATILIVSASRR